MIDLAVQASAMVCHVGLTAPAACAAIRCGLNNFAETRFMDNAGQWITGAEVPLPIPWRGRSKLAQMAAMAVREAVTGMDPNTFNNVPLLLCLAEPDRPGRIPDQDQLLLGEVEQILGYPFHPSSSVISKGRVSGVWAVEKARMLLTESRCRHCLIVGVDTYLTAPTLAAYLAESRILTDDNSDGFIPGEAGCAVLLARAPNAPKAAVVITGLGFGLENAHIRSEMPLRGDGMVLAVKNALVMAGRDLGDLDFRICDISGEQYYFKEAALALARILRVRKETFDIWHPAECLGETGAAVAPAILAVASAAMAKNYAKGNGILCHFANDDGQRAALVLNAAPGADR
jgi:3-oxoacyl-[acyl-carrier-protein] synthase-1